MGHEEEVNHNMFKTIHWNQSKVSHEKVPKASQSQLMPILQPKFTVKKISNNLRDASKFHKWN